MNIPGSWSQVDKRTTLIVIKCLQDVYDWEQQFSLSDVTTPIIRIMKIDRDVFVDRESLHRFIKQASGKNMETSSFADVVKELQRLEAVAHGRMERIS